MSTTKPLIRKFGTDTDGGISWTLGSVVARTSKLIRRGRSIPKNRRQEITNIEKAEAFYEGFGLMLQVAKAKRTQFEPRELVRLPLQH